MRLIPCLFVALLAIGSAAAEVPTTGAKIAQVTVYADRAEVVRHFTTTLPAGEHTLVFDHLPGETDLASVRVTGQGAFTLIDIRAEAVQTTEVTDEQVRAVAAAIKAEQVKSQKVAQAQVRNGQRRSALEKVLGRLTATGKDSPPPDLDPAQWSGYLAYHLATLAKLDEETLALKAEAQASRAESSRLERQFAQLNGARVKARNVASVKIEVKQAGAQSFDLAYVVFGPGWSPQYDVRADTSAKQLTVAYQAQVRQRTGEDWKDVALRLSTAQPGVGGREPELTRWNIGKAQPIVISGGVMAPLGGASADKPSSSTLRRKEAQDESKLVESAALSVAKAPAAAMSYSRADVRTGGTAALFQVPRPYDIPSDPRSVKVGIAEETFPAVFRHSCVPKLSPDVYLKAVAVNKSAYPFLAGPTAVFLDGAYVAAASMDLVPAGQEFTSFLGVDQAVKVERKELAHRDETTGVFGRKTLRTVHDHRFKVTNGKASEIDLTIADQLPLSQHEDIKVVLEEPRYDKDTEAFRLTEQQRLEWRLRLAAGQKTDLPFRFAVERPEDVLIVGQ